jgi:hypothetical protein
MHVPINVKYPNITSKWQMVFNSAFKGLRNVASVQTPTYRFLSYTVYGLRMFKRTEKRRAEKLYFLNARQNFPCGNGSSRILLDDNTSDGAIIMRSIRFLCVGVLILIDSLVETCVVDYMYYHLKGVQLKIGPYFNMSNLFTKIYNMLYYTTNLYL